MGRLKCWRSTIFERRRPTKRHRLAVCVSCGGEQSGIFVRQVARRCFVSSRMVGTDVPFKMDYYKRTGVESSVSSRQKHGAENFPLNGGGEGAQCSSVMYQVLFNKVQICTPRPFQLLESTLVYLLRCKSTDLNNATTSHHHAFGQYRCGRSDCQVREKVFIPASRTERNNLYSLQTSS